MHDHTSKNGIKIKINVDDYDVCSRVAITMLREDVPEQ